jgi:hypothetical protein
MNVITTVSGSHCVVELRPGVNGAYIDARRGFCVGRWGRAEPNGFTNIEVVHSGFVRHSESVSDSRAPARIVELMRRFS